MSTPLNEEDGVNPLGDDEQSSTALPSVAGEPSWFTADSPSSEFAQIQASGSYPAAQNSSAFSQNTASGFSDQRFSESQSTGTKRRGSGVRLLMILVLLVLVVVVGGISFFASAAPNLVANNTGSQTTRVQQTTGANPIPTKKPTLSPTPNVNASPGGTGQAWFPSTLPASCSEAGIMLDQAGNANLEAIQFTLREENISFRNINGLQGATVLMTPQTKALRFVNDKRSTKAFAQQVLNRKLIQMPENLQPVLQQCQQKGGQTFAWTVVSFEMVIQCETSDQGQPCPPNPKFAPEMNQQNQPIVHTMAVLMVAVPSGQANPPLWLGWSVVDYMFDQAPTLPTIPPPGQV